MEVRFQDDDLDRLERDKGFNGGHSQAIVSAFRKQLWYIRAVPDERDLYQKRSLRFERLKGNRSHQHSIRLNKQWRLILELDDNTKPKTILIIGIEDYH